jgi:hypothetical protein
MVVGFMGLGGPEILILLLLFVLLGLIIFFLRRNRAKQRDDGRRRPQQRSGRRPEPRDDNDGADQPTQKTGDQSQHNPDVFISYSTKDKQWADTACAVMEQHRIRCWIAPRDILPGTEWGAAIIAGIDACRIMVLIFSRHANESGQVRREVERAISKGLAVLPFRVEDVRPAGSMEFALSNTHWLDGFTPPVERHMKILAESVNVLLAKNHARGFRPNRNG